MDDTWFIELWNAEGTVEEIEFTNHEDYLEYLASIRKAHQL
jgi:hypothetical protein